MTTTVGFRLLVTHPGRQHSHQTALALHEAGMLAGYWAGVPALSGHGALVPRWLWHRVVHYKPLDLPPQLVRWYPLAPVLRRLGEGFLPRALAARADYAACRLFDLQCAQRLRTLDVDAVIACEISALRTFEVAHRSGAVTILDAPAIHHRAQDALHGFVEPECVHRRIVRVKDAEIATADHILVCSALARDTYLDAGVPPDRVHIVTLGVDLDLFVPSSGSAPAGREAFAFFFAGATIERKGFDVLLQAFSKVREEAPGTCLEVAGPMGMSPRGLDTGDGTGVRMLGKLSQSAFSERLRHADCLVLPSREDSFGMVVLEALACGVPVIVSTMVGAKDVVTEGVTGWIVPAGNAEALAERMLWCVRHREVLRPMRPACRRAALRFSWKTHHARLVSLIADLLAAGQA